MTTMNALRSPQEAYRRVDFDARVAGADPRQLVVLCFEQLTSALGSSLFADRAGDNQLKSLSLTRALTALTALRMGIDHRSDIAPALSQLYDSARRAMLDSVLKFDPKVIERVRSDFREIGETLAAASAR
jgi:flagellin-specific chaperone FliS